MNLQNTAIFSRWNHKRLYLYWTICYFGGIFLGIIGGWNCSVEEVLFESLFSSSVSVISSIIVFHVPILIFHLVLKIFQVIPIVLFGFLCGFVRGCCGILCLHYARNASWLLRPILFFPGISVSVILWWILIRYVQSSNQISKHDFILFYFLAFVMLILNVTRVALLFSSVAIIL